MATEKQIAANRANARKSTGPQSEEGKGASRGNAMKHGMTARVVRPNEMKQAAADRYEAWQASFQPKDSYQEYQLQLYVDASLQHENCKLKFAERIEQLAEIAEEGGLEWKAQCQEATLKVAKSLKRDPESTVHRLRKTPAGRALLIRKWKTIKLAAFGIGGDWTDDLRTQSCALVIDDRENHETIMTRSVYLSEPARISAWIDRKIAELEELQAKFDERDEQELRQAQIEGFPAVDDESLNRFKRYVSAAKREMATALKAFSDRPALDKPTDYAGTNPISSPSGAETNPISRSSVAETNPISQPEVVEMKPIPEPAIERTQPIPAKEEAQAELIAEEQPVSHSRVQWRGKQMTHRAKMRARQEAREAKKKAKQQVS